MIEREKRPFKTVAFLVYYYSGTVTFAEEEAPAINETGKTSSQIVGFSTIAIPTGYSMFTPVFDKIQGDFTLGDIMVCNENGQEFDNVAPANGGTGRSMNQIIVRRVNASSTLGLASAWQYTSVGYPDKTKSTWGWKTAKGQVLQSGEGLMVLNSTGSTVYFQTSGQVQLKPQMNIPTGYSMWGNNTPCDIKLGDIMVCNLDGEEFDNVAPASGGTGRSMNQIIARKVNESSTLGLAAAWQYTSVGYPDKTKSTWGWKTAKSQTIKAGEALLILNSTGAECKFVLKGPFDKSYDEK